MEPFRAVARFAFHSVAVIVGSEKGACPEVDRGFGITRQLPMTKKKPTKVQASPRRTIRVPVSDLIAVPYLRCSTDDRGQDPERQLEVIQPWAAREGVSLLDAVIDEGTSASKTDPFERPKFVEACERAKAAGAHAIVVECSDRFSRQGSKRDSWAEVELERRYGLRLLRADKSVEQHDSMVGAVTDSIHAEGARAWVQAHSNKVRSGMARKKSEGARFGRPAKPLTPAELALVGELRARGHGWRRCALAVSERRGAFRIADPERRRKLTVSYSHIRRQLESVSKVEPFQKS
jgi:DNA invertase Pin-like site-specific DNA recombinase